MEWFKEQLGWFIGDVVALICFIILFPLVPAFALFDKIRSIHEEK